MFYTQEAVLKWYYNLGFFSPSLKKRWVVSWRSLAWCPTKEPSWPTHTTCCVRTGAFLLVGLILLSLPYGQIQQPSSGMMWQIVLSICPTDLELYNEALKVIHDFPQHYPFEVAASGWGSLHHNVTLCSLELSLVCAHCLLHVPSFVNKIKTKTCNIKWVLPIKWKTYKDQIKWICCFFINVCHKILI